MEWVGVLAIILMVVITCVDVLGAKILRRPFFAAIDLVMLCQLVAIPFAASATLLVGKHIQVEFFVRILPRRIRFIVDASIYLFSLILFVVITWQLFVYGRGLQSSGELSSTARIPLDMFAYGAALACVPVCLILCIQFISSLTSAGEK